MRKNPVMLTVCEVFDQDNGDDLMIRRSVEYALRDLASTGPEADRADWDAATIAERVPRASFVVVVLAGHLEGDAIVLGPKCLAAILAAQASGVDYLVLCPFRQYARATEHVRDLVECLNGATRDGVPLTDEEVAAAQREVVGRVSARAVQGGEVVARIPHERLTMSIDAVVQRVTVMIGEHARALIGDHVGHGATTDDCPCRATDDRTWCAEAGCAPCAQGAPIADRADPEGSSCVERDLLR